MPDRITEQAGAILHRRGEFLIVTTNAGGWSIPKGGIERGETSAEAAAREALEEAGVEGEVDPAPFEIYEYAKFGGRYRVTVHLLKVTRVLDDWEEKEERERQWITVAQIPKAVSYANIVKMLQRASESVTG
jgi:8-oxo-dGTP pyrophosphatase MutT (NUDIX family)